MKKSIRMYSPLRLAHAALALTLALPAALALAQPASDAAARGERLRGELQESPPPDVKR